MIRKYIIEADDSIKGFDEEIARLEREWGAEEIEPCEDCISRAYIESIVEELENICINGDEHILSLLSNIKNAPSVTPKTSCESCREQVLKHLEKEDWADTVNCVMNMPFINKPCVSEGVCREDKMQVLDKIRAEIEQSPVNTITNWDGCCPDFDCPEIEYVTKNEMLNIIDRYRTESEEDE